MSGETVIHPEGVPCRFAFLSERNLGGGELLVQHTDSNLPPIRLSLSARRIWDLCDGRNSISGIAQELAKVVSVRTKDLLGDVRAAISRLELAHVLIVRRDGRRHDLWHRTIDWSRVAEPQLDEYDTNITLRLSAIPSESKYTTIDKRAETRCERIRVCRIYPKKNGLQDAPLDHGNINTAISYLRLWPTLYLQFIRIISVFHPRLDPTQPMGVDAQGSRCHSAESMSGTMWSTINCPLLLAENFAHELAHQKAFGLGILKEAAVRIVRNDPGELFASPVRKCCRPMTAVFHAAYAFAYVSALDLHWLDMGIDERIRPKAAARLAENVVKMNCALSIMRKNIFLDDDGMLFMKGFYSWCKQIDSRGRRFLAVEPRISRKV